MFGIRRGVVVGVAAALLCVESPAEAGPASPQSAPQPPSAVGTASDGPALRFGDAPIQVRRSHKVYYPGDQWHNDDYNVGLYYIHRLDVEDQRADGSEPLEFAVDRRPDGPSSQICSGRECRDARLVVRRKSGLLHLEMDPLAGVRSGASQLGARGLEFPIADYPGQRAELSAEDAATGLKVYREEFVAPPADAPDCSAYPDMDVERYTCLFLGEQLPERLPDTPTALRDALPDHLVQPKENYRLVFAEEFDHPVVTADDCANGMVNLGGMWNYDTDPCNNTGARGVPCFNVADGHFYFARTHTCQGRLESQSKFEFKYGYLEAKYTVGFDSYRASVIHAFVLWSGGKFSPLKYRRKAFGVEPTNHEQMSKYLGAEIDFFEFIVPAKADLYNQYLNAFWDTRHPGVEPRISSKRISYCRDDRDATRELMFTPPSCDERNEATVIKGLEWTPRGYRTLLKVEGVHTDFIVIPQKFHHPKYRPAIPGGYGRWRTFPEDEPVFEYLDPDDENSILEGVAVAHAPSPIFVSAWGYPTRRHNYVRDKVQIDYIRVFRPANGYRDMEPVYE